jgi:hypothetical protein
VCWIPWSNNSLGEEWVSERIRCDKNDDANHNFGVRQLVCPRVASRIVLENIVIDLLSSWVL